MNVAISEDTVVGEVYIDAEPEAVFDALVNPDDLAAWWGSDDTYRTFNWQVDLRPGGRWSCEAQAAAGGPKSTVHGRYLEIERPRALAYTWNPSWASLPETEVRYTLERQGGGTLVRTVHSGFASNRQEQEDHTQGWTKVLGWLAEYARRKA